MILLFAILLAACLPSSVLSSPPNANIKTVTISGGTHGNEYTGIWCIKAIEKQRQLYNDGLNIEDVDRINVFKEYPSLNIKTLLANPKAYIANRRFIDTDMNREFSITKLQRTAETENCSESEEYEALRAKEIAASHVSTSDVVIDLHTTTANMGITIILTEGDVLMSRAAAFVLHKCKREYRFDNVHILLLPKTEKQDRTHLASIGNHDISIEVGPTPQGVIRHDIVEQTEAAMHSLLDFFHSRNMEENNDMKVMEHLREEYPNGVPCYQSAKATSGKALHGKIEWPVDPTNPNFPAAMIHKSLQDRDYQPILSGDPLFVNLDGTVIPYDGSFGEEVLLMFVNEGGYYYSSSGHGIGVAVSSRYDLETGDMVS